MTIISDNASPLAGNSYNWTGDSRGVGNIKVYGQDIEVQAGDTTYDTANHDNAVLPLGRRTTLVIANGWDRDVTLTIFIKPSPTAAGTATIYTATLAAGATIVLTPDAGGTGATGLAAVPALQSPAYQLTVRYVTTTTAPTTGSVSVYAQCA